MKVLRLGLGSGLYNYKIRKNSDSGTHVSSVVFFNVTK